MAAKVLFDGKGLKGNAMAAKVLSVGFGLVRSPWTSDGDGDGRRGGDGQ